MRDLFEEFFNEVADRVSMDDIRQFVVGDLDCERETAVWQEVLKTRRFERSAVATAIQWLCVDRSSILLLDERFIVFRLFQRAAGLILCVRGNSIELGGEPCDLAVGLLRDLRKLRQRPLLGRELELFVCAACESKRVGETGNACFLMAALLFALEHETPKKIEQLGKQLIGEATEQKSNFLQFAPNQAREWSRLARDAPVDSGSISAMRILRMLCDLAGT